MLLTSLKVDRVSMAEGGMAKEEGGPMSSGPGWTLDRLTDVKIDVRKTNNIPAV